MKKEAINFPEEYGELLYTVKLSLFHSMERTFFLIVVGTCLLALNEFFSTLVFYRTADYSMFYDYLYIFSILLPFAIIPFVVLIKISFIIANQKTSTIYILENGMYSKSLLPSTGQVFIPWTDVVDVEIRSIRCAPIHKIHYIVMITNKAYLASETQKNFWEWSVLNNRSMIHVEDLNKIYIMVDHYNYDYDEIQEMILTEIEEEHKYRNF